MTNIFKLKTEHRSCLFHKLQLLKVTYVYQNYRTFNKTTESPKLTFFVAFLKYIYAYVGSKTWASALTSDE